MKASRLVFTLLLASSVAADQLAAQQTKAEQKPIEEVKAKAEAGGLAIDESRQVGFVWHVTRNQPINRCVFVRAPLIENVSLIR